MGLLEKLFGRKPSAKERARAQALMPYFKTITGYSATFSTYSGGVYEQALTRAAIDRFATACSKLKPEVSGTAQPRIARAFRTSPNEFQTWPQFLYRTATILECDTTAFVVKVFGRDLNTVTGLWTLKPEYVEVVEMYGEPWFRFHMGNGEVKVIEVANVCVLTKFQYGSDFFGSGNVLDATMKLIDAQEQAQDSAIRNGATIRFVGAVNGMMKDEDIEEKRKKFVADNLGPDNESGLLIYDNTFSDMKQVDPTHYVIDTAEMERIDKNVYDYFGVNEDIVQNKFDENVWDAYYEGKVEPFAVQLGEGLSRILYTQQERNRNGVMFSSNRLSYSSNASKRNMITNMIDRGVMSRNDARAVLQLPPIEGGDEYVIRGEYILTDNLADHTVEAAKSAQKGKDLGVDDTNPHDVEKKQFDTDAKGAKEPSEADGKN